VLYQACQGYGGILSEPPPKVYFQRGSVTAPGVPAAVWISQPMRQTKIKFS